jgi:hypothetical protein
MDLFSMVNLFNVSTDYLFSMVNLFNVSTDYLIDTKTERKHDK